jgi:hypothetical protein
MPSTTLLIQIVVAIGGFSGLASLVQTLLSRQKGHADVQAIHASTAQVVTNTATSLIEPLEKRILAQGRQNEELQEQVDGAAHRERVLREQHAREREEFRAELDSFYRREILRDAALRVHARWDARMTDALSQVAVALEEIGIHIEPPPPLYPPPPPVPPPPPSSSPMVNGAER